MEKLMGKKCKDIVTGFEGICVGFCESISGCRQFILQPVSDRVDEKKRSAYFFEKQLEVIGEGLKDVELPEYTEPVLLGKECIDKVTKIKGVCSGRITWLFAGPQYMLEYLQNGNNEDASMICLDEGRLEVVGDKVAPEDVQGTRTGSIFRDEEYPGWRVTSKYWIPDVQE